MLRTVGYCNTLRKGSGAHSRHYAKSVFPTQRHGIDVVSFGNSLHGRTAIT